MKEEKIRLKGHMRTHKALIKSIIRTRKFEISCISAPQPVKGREDGYCYMYIDGYPTEGSVEADVYEENRRMFEDFCSTRKQQLSSRRKYKNNRI